MPDPFSIALASTPKDNGDYDPRLRFQLRYTVSGAIFLSNCHDRLKCKLKWQSTGIFIGHIKV